MSNQKRSFNSMNYQQVQKLNSNNRKQLTKEDQKWLKDHNFKNVGWEYVISLYQQIEDFIDKHKLEDLSLEELFWEADRIGNKYLTDQEIQEFNQKLAIEFNAVDEEIEKLFPDTEIEIVDFSQGKKVKSKAKQKKRK